MRTRARRPGIRREAVRVTRYGELVLVASTDPDLQRQLSEHLGVDGYRAVLASSVSRIEELAAKIRPVVIVLDLDEASGGRLAVLARIREQSTAPVIVLSERASEGDKVTALDAGADDYLAKPFGKKELLARVRVALRYVGARPAGDEPLEVGPIRIDAARHRVTMGDRPVHLTPIEFRLLVLLARFRGAVVRREQLVEEVWGTTTDHTDHLRVHIAALRRKIEPEPARPRWLVTVVRIGYRLGDRDE